MIKATDATVSRDAVIDGSGAGPTLVSAATRERRTAGAVVTDDRPDASAPTESGAPVERRRPRGVSLNTARAARPRLRPAPRPVPGSICPAERVRAARIGCWLFRHRGVLPVPLLLAALCLPTSMTIASWGLGLVVLAVAETLRLAGVAAAGAGTRRRSRTVAHLVTDGPFAWMRNPLYFGNGLAWTGVAAITGIGWLVPAGIVAFAIEYSLIVRYEEGVLESLFGETYLAYKRRTPRWLPKRPQPGPRPLGRGYDWREAWRSESSTFTNLALVMLALVIKLVVSR